MKKILIISPHYPPSNLAGVHRSRLFAQHLPSFGWEPVILTVNEHHYEETLDWNLFRLLPEKQRIEKVAAFPLTKPRLVGDIGLRSYFNLRKRAMELIKEEQVDFVYIPIPSFYIALIGPYLHRKAGVRYGIDYIDPWVHSFPGSEKIFSRHWWSTKMATWLEPRAVRKASLITGVAEGYFTGVIDRNPALKKNCLFGAMPYGGEASDHEALRRLNLEPYLFVKNKKLQLVYAGAFLPKSEAVLRGVFEAIAAKKEMFGEVEFHFIGTGKTPTDPTGYNIRPLAEEMGLWQTVVFEYPGRIPYLDVLTHLNAADAVLILGSTETHYTPSKLYQAVLSRKPVFAVLHSQSTAVSILKKCSAGIVLQFDGERAISQVRQNFAEQFQKFLGFAAVFDPADVSSAEMENYSAKEVTRTLANLLDQVVKDDEQGINKKKRLQAPNRQSKAERNPNDKGQAESWSQKTKNR